MKMELVTTLAGETSLEVIGETPFEVSLLERAWTLHGYERANGQSIAKNGGSTGFYIPLFQITILKDREKS